MKKALVAGAVLAGIAAVGVPAAQAETPAGGQACQVTVHAGDGASNQVIHGDANGVGNGQGVTVTRDCRPQAAAAKPAAAKPAARKPATRRPNAAPRATVDCRRVPRRHMALCYRYLAQLDAAMRRAPQSGR